MDAMYIVPSETVVNNSSKCIALSALVLCCIP